MCQNATKKSERQNAGNMNDALSVPHEGAGVEGSVEIGTLLRALQFFVFCMVAI
jgi:hypothetical protein